MKLTKEEIRDRKRAIRDIVNMEGWPYVRLLMEEFAMMKQNELFLTEGSDKDSVLAKGYALKYGTEALSWFLNQAESIKNELDNE